MFMGMTPGPCLDRWVQKAQHKHDFVKGAEGKGEEDR